MHVSFEHNIREVERSLSDLGRRQVPFATSLALNDTAEAIRANTVKALDRRLDRPTPYTKRGLAILRSSKSHLAAAVLFKDRQAAYLRWQEKGGARRPSGRAIPVPVSITRNRYGNMARGAVKRALARTDTFSGRPGGGRLPPGVYRRIRGGGLQLLVAYEKAASYAPRLRFAADAERTALRFMPIAFERALRRAFASAR